MWNPKIRNPFSAVTPVLRATRGACCCARGGVPTRGVDPLRCAQMFDYACTSASIGV